MTKMISIASAAMCAALLLLPARSHAASRSDGNELLGQCKPVLASGTPPNEDFGGAMFCVGLVQGITSTHGAYIGTDRAPLFCLPEDGIKNVQGVRIIVKYLESHPERLHLDPSFLALTAMADAFPCK